ncbi:g9072 [Coccomyxa elongata]
MPPSPSQRKPVSPASCCICVHQQLTDCEPVTALPDSHGIGSSPPALLHHLQKFPLWNSRPSIHSKPSHAPVRQPLPPSPDQAVPGRLSVTAGRALDAAQEPSAA